MRWTTLVGILIGGLIAIQLISALRGGAIGPDVRVIVLTTDPVRLVLPVDVDAAFIESRLRGILAASSDEQRDPRMARYVKEVEGDTQLIRNIAQAGSNTSPQALLQGSLMRSTEWRSSRKRSCSSRSPSNCCPRITASARRWLTKTDIGSSTAALLSDAVPRSCVGAPRELAHEPKQPSSTHSRTSIPGYTASITVSSSTPPPVNTARRRFNRSTRSSGRVANEPDDYGSAGQISGATGSGPYSLARTNPHRTIP